MSRIEKTFKELGGNKAFMPYLVAGDPDIKTTKKLILAMTEAGASLIELGVPFSDPMADGPTNQLAAERALKSGTTLEKVIALVKDVRKDTQIPILLMGYYNPFHSYGIEKLCKDAADAGVDGFIIPDLQPDDADEVRTHMDAAGVDTVFLIAPTSTDERIKLVAKQSRGFVYAVSLTGVTGERSALPAELGDFIARARKHIDLPICVGFGISTPEAAKGVGEIADGVIVGSAIVKRINAAAENGDDPAPIISAFVKEMVAALK